MITKSFVERNGATVALVTFTLPSTLWVGKVNLVGDFNEWDEESHPLEQQASGEWAITVELAAGDDYQFRYLVDGEEWMNDPQADGYVHNFYGSTNFIVVTDPGHHA